MGKHNRKRKTPPAASTVTPTRSASKSPKNKAVTGKFLVDVYDLAIKTNEDLHDHWFGTKDLCAALPTYSSVLKGVGIEDRNKWPQKFSRQMNLRSPQEVYNEKSENGFYVNKYGTEKQYYYLYTKKDKCPNPPRTDGNFYPSNIKNFVPQMEEDGDTNNNSNDDNNKREDPNNGRRSSGRF
eukprot:scaffold10315_cov101-Skeletonema_dohrnii-CCMP3373.AAC.1